MGSLYQHNTALIFQMLSILPLMEHLLLLHGAIGAKDHFAALTPPLAERYLIHTMNFSGHGGAPLPRESFSISLFANEVIAYLDEHGVISTHIFGYSMGGYVGFYLAKYFPARVEKIITLGTRFSRTPEIAEKESAMLDADTLLEKFPAFAMQLREMHAPNDWKVVLEQTKLMLSALGADNTLKLSCYQGIRHHCLLMVGEKDRMVGPDETAQIAGVLPNAVCRILADTPHPLEKVDIPVLTGTIKDFIG